MSVATLLSTPRAKGLFHRAIVESGTAHSINSPVTATRIGRRRADKLGVATTREAIAANSPERVLEAQAELRDELLARPDTTFWAEVALSSLPWAPTVDGDTIPGRPIDGITDDAVVAMAGAYGLPPESLSAYRAAHQGASAGELFSAIPTDGYWRIPAIRLADAHA